ncbi:hypothetical protein C8Q80DRAFT_1054837, partial [Daedaleopsis nitida]
PEEEAYMCPVRALWAWLKIRKGAPGFLFPSIKRGDHVGPCDQPMPSPRFLGLFRHSLVDIGVSPDMYGTHSFRRGGCQYLCYGRRWSLHRLCEWGGWSLDCNNLTITRYLIGDVDDSFEDRADYLNPNRESTVICGSCGRGCHCG